MNYRAEVDGLRTVAVLSVIIYHAQFALAGGKFLPGGFLGVDVFFVISGFLITSLMLKEFAQTGTVSVRNFYRRRARRLLPALLLVMLCTLPLAWTLLLPEQLIDFCKSQVASLLFSSNFYWHSSLQQYGAESGQLKPFLHTWSLAVEEQYYLIFPLLFIALFRWWRGRAVMVLAMLLVASLTFAVWITPRDAALSFYMLPSRLWELLAGALLAFAMFREKNNVQRRRSGAAATIGLLLILTPMALVNFEAVKHPGIATLPTICGTLLLIWAARGDHWVARLLGSRPFVGIGLVSYSLYLWHYPIFAFARIQGDQLQTGDKLALVALTFALSAATYYLVERPFRRQQAISASVFAWSTAASLGLVLVFSILVVEKDLWLYRLEPELAALEKSRRDLRNDRKALIRVGQCQWEADMGDFAHYLEEFPACNPAADDQIVVIGDSHGADIFAALKHFGSPDIRTRVVQITGSGCSLEDRRRQPESDCAKLMNYAVSYLEEYRDSVSAVVFAERGTIKSGEAISATDILQRITASSPLFRELPFFYVTRPHFGDISAAIREVKDIQDFRALERRSFSKALSREQATLADLLSASASMRAVNLEKIFCAGGPCDLLDRDNRLYYVDYGHLSRHGMEKTGVYLSELLQRELPSPSTAASAQRSAELGTNPPVKS